MVFCLQHTIGNNPSRKPDYVKFHPWGLGPANKGGLKSLESIAQELHHIGRAVHIFKIDVEGAEFALMRDLLTSGALCARVDNLWMDWHPSRISWAKVRLPISEQEIFKMYNWMLTSMDNILWGSCRR